jgi:hypothetical protein
MAFIDNIRTHAELGYALTEVLRRLLLPELPEIEKVLQRKGRCGRNTRHLNLMEGFAWGRQARGCSGRWRNSSRGEGNWSGGGHHSGIWWSDMLRG